MLETLRLTLNPGTVDERQYDIYPVQDTSGRQRKEATSIAPPGTPPSSNILLGVSGMQGDITIQATAWDDGSDRANGTAPTGVFTNDTVVTVEEQITYLEEYIHAPDFSATWELDHTTGAMFDNDEVFVESVDPTYIDQQSPKWKSVRISLRRGGSV
jgi:hypothetical protein